ncbi:hypothetical protein Tco_0430279, partial [Tanacetum coccineum]
MPPLPSSSAPRYHLHHPVAINTTNITSSPPTVAAAIITHHHPYYHIHATIDVHYKGSFFLNHHKGAFGLQRPT